MITKMVLYFIRLQAATHAEILGGRWVLRHMGENSQSLRHKLFAIVSSMGNGEVRPMSGGTETEELSDVSIKICFVSSEERCPHSVKV